jgi:ADP-heptose:LPS heptosyltransferase
LSLKIVDPARKLVHPNGRKIIFSHRRALGDGLMFTAGVRDFKLLFPEIAVGVDTNMPELFENSPYVDRSLKKGDPGVEFYRVGYPSIASANNTYIHFSQMFLLDMVAVSDLSAKLPLSLGEFCASFANGEVGDPDLGLPEKTSEAREPFISVRKKYRGLCEKFSRMRGDVHMTDAEKSMNIIRDIYNVTEPYWVIAPGGKRDCTTKIWDWRRFQRVIDYFEGRLKFVVIGKSDLLVEPLSGVVNLVDKFNTGVRGLFSLIYNSHGCVSGPSFLMHAAAAAPPQPGQGRKPCVTILGGREPAGWTWYTNHQILHTNGAFSCCSSGGCWKARTIPLPKDPKHNKSLCKKQVECDGRTIQGCMDVITHTDVIRAIEKYYEGDLYTYTPLPEPRVIDILPEPEVHVGDSAISTEHEINLLGNLHVDGGGEQSLCTIARVLSRAGWHVNLFSWCGVNDKLRTEFPDLTFSTHTFEKGMLENMPAGVPLLFYANDRTRAFADRAEDIVAKSSSVTIGINYMNSPLSRCEWLARSGKVRTFVFQNQEKLDEFNRDSLGFDAVRKISLFGAIDLDHFTQSCPQPREKGAPLVVLKHCVPDYRKYVTTESEGKGDKIHLWQKKLAKEKDTVFYSRLLKEVPQAQFEFMEAHEELVKHFHSEPRMVFHKWDAMPVTDFLARGHVYLYRTSNLWRDQYPRVVAEALAVGLPVLTEPRDGTKDRVQHGDTGFYCVDYDGFRYALKMLERKEDYRHTMGQRAREWAVKNLDPRKWVEVIELG